MGRCMSPQRWNR